MPSSTDITLLASAARTVSGTGASVDLGTKTGLQLDLAVSAASGTTPNLTVTLETSKDGTTWRTLGAFAAVTAAGPVAKVFAGADRYLRAIWTISGTTPSFTFGLSGQALGIFATPADVTRLAIASEALASVDAEVLADHLITNTGDIEDRLRNRFKLPLTRWPRALNKHLASITAWTVLSHRGVNPTTGDVDIRSRHDAAWKAVVDIAENRAGSDEDYVDSAPEVHDAGPYVYCSSRRRR
jgi:phage gp36-like protein